MSDTWPFLYAGIAIVAAVVLACLRYRQAARADRRETEALRRHVEDMS